MKDISIIGATSHLGVHLVGHLAALGCNVTASYRYADRIPETWGENAAIRPVQLDLNQQINFERICAERVIWLAHLDQGRFNEHETETNLRPFERFLHASRNSSVKQIVFISSGGSVYGEAQELPIKEDHPRHPLSSYGKAKKEMEDALFGFGRSTDINIAIIRPGNIYGFEDPFRNSKGIVGAFLEAMTRRTSFTLIDQGRTVRDFIHVDDVCQAIACALQNKEKEKIWNAATGIPSKIADVLEMVARSSLLPLPQLIHRPNYSSDVQTNVLSIDRITSESGWQPKTEIEAGVDAAVNNWIAKYSLSS
jgi:UDP-glucose 4-epimerase